MFSSAGVSATRMRDIAQSVGVSPPALYHWFENLDAIVEALLEYVVVESAAYATAVADGPGRCADRIGTLITQHVERLTSGPYDLWFVVGMSESESRRFVAIGRRAAQWRRAVAGLVAEGVASGEFRPIDVDLAVASLSGLVYGALQHRHRCGAVDAVAVASLAVASLERREGERS